MSRLAVFKTLSEESMDVIRWLDRTLIKLVLRHARLRRLLLPVPFPVWEFLARASSMLRTPPLTKAQVTLMRQDNVVSNSALTLEDLGIDPIALERILPNYALSDGQAAEANFVQGVNHD